jgi:hypothetical protein
MTAALTPIAAISIRTGGAGRRRGGAAGRTVGPVVAVASGTATCAGAPPPARAVASHTVAAAMSASPSSARFTRPPCGIAARRATAPGDQAIGAAD